MRDAPGPLDAAPALYPDANTFLANLGPELERKEAENNLILAVAMGHARAQREGHRVPPTLYASLRVADPHPIVLLMTPPAPLILAADRLPAGATSSLVRFLLDQPFPVHGVIGPAPLVREFADAWLPATGSSIRSTRGEDLYCADRVASAPESPSGMIRADRIHFQTVLEWTLAANAEAGVETDIDEAVERTEALIGEGAILLWVDGSGPVAMATRSRPTANGICIDTVFVAPQYRRRGFGAGLVRALTTTLLQEFAFCVLSVDAENHTAKRLYERLGYRRVVPTLYHQFEPVEPGPKPRWSPWAGNH